MSSSPHISVLLQETLTVFQDLSVRIFVDGTLGVGGHADALLTAHPEIELYIGIDQDPIARSLARERLARHGKRVEIVADNARNLQKILAQRNITHIDGMMMDLGVSSMQLDRPEKGFSFRLDGPLDMRMNPSASLTAETIVNEWEEAELARIFRDYGEEKRWRAAARAVVQARSMSRISTTHELVTVLESVLKRPRHGKVNPLTLVFQALRIAVNDELGVVEDVLPQVIDVLRPGGRLAMISFHSLEDRIVKRYFQNAASDKEQTTGLSGLFLDKDPTVRILTRKPMIASEEEQESNRRSRSARMRAVERT